MGDERNVPGPWSGGHALATTSGKKLANNSGGKSGGTSFLGRGPNGHGLAEGQLEGSIGRGKMEGGGKKAALR